MAHARFHIVAKKKDATTGELQLYGDIGPSFWGNGIDDKMVASSLKKLKDEGAKDLHVYVNSIGGNVFHGIAIYNQIKRWEGKKHVYVDGIAASIASIIAMAGDEIHMGKGSQMMIHEPSGGAHGNAKDLEKTAKVIRGSLDEMVNIYVARTGQAESKIREMLSAETWMKSHEAVNEKFATDIVDDSNWADGTTAQMRLVASASPLYASFRNVPNEVKEFLASLPENPAQPRNPEENKNMDFMKMMAKALGLSENATEADILMAITSIRASANTAETLRASAGSLGEIVALTGNSTFAEAKGTVLAWKDSHEKMGTYVAEQKAKEALAQQIEMTAMLDKAVLDGQIPPAMKGFWAEQAKSHPNTLRSYVATAAKSANGGVIPAGGTITPPGAAALPAAAILVPDDEQEKMFKQAGITDEKVKAEIRKSVAEQNQQIAASGMRPLTNTVPVQIRGM